MKAVTRQFLLGQPFLTKQSQFTIDWYIANLSYLNIIWFYSIPGKLRKDHEETRMSEAQQKTGCAGAQVLSEVRPKQYKQHRGQEHACAPVPFFYSCCFVRHKALDEKFDSRYMCGCYIRGQKLTNNLSIIYHNSS